MSEPLSAARVLELAAKWSRLHAKPQWRDRMDECLTGLSESDARRVVLCGQRMAAGLPPKVLPAETPTKEGVKNNGNTTSKTTKATARRKRDTTAKPGAQAVETKTSVGA